MALLNGIYVFVDDEQVTRDMDVSSHSVEKGISTTDTVKRKPTALSISGVIVDVPIAKKSIVSETSGLRTGYEDVFLKAADILSIILSLKDKGSLIAYSGRNLLYNMQITSFQTSHNNNVWGGAEFSMELQECRLARNAYVAPVVQDTSVKDGGQQQIEKGENEEVSYTVKKGDTIWGLIWQKPNGERGDYRDYKREGADPNVWKENRDWVMNKNPDAFSRKGDDRTMQIGAKLILGTR